MVRIPPPPPIAFLPDISHSYCMSYHTFVENLIKGRIAETIFKLMVAETNKYAVIPAGYEHILPMLAPHTRDFTLLKSLETIRKSPDFILISQDKNEVIFVEVKYQATHSIDILINSCQQIIKNWDEAYLFVATPDGFYFDSCSNIIATANILQLDTTFISDERQQAYLKILNTFIHVPSVQN